MRTPTHEQQAVLDSTARVRIVRAAPGSGKTWLVAELIRQELDRWPTRTSGIAALSFTRVGGDEINNAIGYDLDHPHFVGTIDAFLFRYVIRPFLRCCFPRFAKPRLIPGEWGANQWNKYGLNLSANVGQGINLFSCVFIDEQQGRSVVAYKPHPAQPLKRLTGDDLRKVKDGKKQIWERSGYLTHSDASLWASKILEHEPFGRVVRAEVMRRFPLLIVDELQDTGFFLGKSIRLILAEPAIRGVLVGDPDQAIYEFNGARPDLFDGFEMLPGAVSLPLANSRRCPASVINVAKHLKDSSGEIHPVENREGHAFLVRFSDMRTDVEQIIRAVISHQNGSCIKVVARSSETISKLDDCSSSVQPKLGCPALNHIQRAVIAFRQGRMVAALSAARAAIDVAVFEHEGVSDDKLNQSRIDVSDWRQLSIQCLLKTNALPLTGNIFDWQKAAGKILDDELSAFDLDVSLNFATENLKPMRRPQWDNAATDCLPQPRSTSSSLVNIPILTVHGVKGETHDVTIFVCPPTSPARCPSVVWWSTDSKDREEKRIAFVAMTRTQGDLIVSVSEDCFQRFAANRPQFVAGFECMTVAEYIGRAS